jgi:hypothetical protein
MVAVSAENVIDKGVSQMDLEKSKLDTLNYWAPKAPSDMRLYSNYWSLKGWNCVKTPDQV